MCRPMPTAQISTGFAPPAPPVSARACACAHCGLPCPDGAPWVTGERTFCCAGCQTVFELLAETGLGSFYELGREAGLRIRRPDRAPAYDFLDQPAVREALLDFDTGDQARATFRVPGIHCMACVWLLENLCRLREGIGRQSTARPYLAAIVELKENRLL